jgi:hypothetical protein
MHHRRSRKPQVVKRQTHPARGLFPAFVGLAKPILAVVPRRDCRLLVQTAGVHCPRIVLCTEQAVRAPFASEVQARVRGSPRSRDRLLLAVDAGQGPVLLHPACIGGHA